MTVPVNRENAALAAAYAETKGIARDTIRRALNAFAGVPGRMEYVQKKPFAVVVDYAHTPDSLERLYAFLRTGHRGRLVAVLGAAGGGRDRWKRSEMGRIAARSCDLVILTNEDPYDEPPERIIAEIAAGIPSEVQEKVRTVPDRREALREALHEARPGDIVVATGKGSELAIHLARGKTVPWNEREVIEEFLRV
jgi:UDP-N-acetylmuramoyl-L-alanyl-D-glutamate--2,6-diaminopimelate ligase